MNKSKTEAKPKMGKKEKEASKGKKIKGNRPNPGIEEIREKANEIYLQRVDRDEPGTAESDWVQAEKYFTES
jgi:hypothetical protein